MGALIKKELKSIFSTPLGYGVIAIFTFYSALVFFGSTLMLGSSDTTSFFLVLIPIIIVIAAILSVKFFCEEQKNKTDQLLITSPISLFSIVFSKFLSGLIVFTASMLPTLLFIIPLMVLGSPDYGAIFCNYIGLILLGAALTSISVFISSLTQSQIISAIVSLFSLFFFYLLFDYLVNMITSFASNISIGFKDALVSFFSVFMIYKKYSQFSYGIFDISATVYYLSIISIFLFLTVKVLEKRRWK